MYDPTAGPFLCPPAEAPPLVSDPPPPRWSSVQEAQMSHRVHLREPIKLENVSTTEKKRLRWHVSHTSKAQTANRDKGSEWVL